MCIDPAWEPLESLNSKGKHVGFSADYMDLLRRNLNIKIEVYPTKTWGDSIKAFEQRKCDIFSQIAETPSRLKTMLFTPPYVKIPNVIIGTSKNEEIKKFSELKKLKIGVIEGYAYAELLLKKYPDYNFVLVKNSQDGLLKVASYEIDVMVDFLSSTSFYIDKLALSSLKFLGKTDLDLELGISTHIDQPILLSILSKGVRSVSPGETQALKNKYINTSSENDYSILLKSLALFVIVFLILTIWSITLKRVVNSKTKELSESERYTRMLFETSPVGFALCRMDGSLVDINPEYCNIIGYSKEEALKLSYWDVTPKSYEEQEGVQLESLNKTGSYGPYEKHYIHKSGSHIPVRLNGQIIEKDGEQYIWSSIENITEQKEYELSLEDTNAYLEQKIQERTAELEKASEAKSRFLATMSHELRTPLNGIVAPIELLKEFDNYSKEQKDLLNVTYTSTKQMYLIINDILDFSKIEYGDLSVERIKFNLREVVGSIVNILTPQAEQKAISLTSSIDDHIAEEVVGDPTRLNQILLNLVNNSLKFTDKGGISISVFLVEVDGKPFIEYSVSDTGIGIEEEKIGELFKPFSQADTSTTRLFGGTGLGLTIVKKLVELQGGSVECLSKLGQGAIFKIKLPLLDMNTMVAEEKPDLSKEELVLTTSLNILVVEDNLVNQMVVKKILEKLEHKVTLVSNGQEALDTVQQQDFDLVLMDWQMPVMDGIEATKKIRALGGKYSDLIITGITANVFDEDKETCLEAGMNDVLQKPITIADFKNSLLSNFS